MNVPQHIAIILDGNGRWAKAKGMPRNYGHAQGSKNVEKICEAAYKMGVKYLTVYAFSTENWSRPKSEVDALMKLLRNYMKTCLKTAEKNRMCVRVLGDKTRLDEDIRNRIAELEEATKNNDGLPERKQALHLFPNRFLATAQSSLVLQRVPERVSTKQLLQNPDVAAEIPLPSAFHLLRSFRPAPAVLSSWLHCWKSHQSRRNFPALP